MFCRNYNEIKGFWLVSLLDEWLALRSCSYFSGLTIVIALIGHCTLIAWSVLPAGKILAQAGVFVALKRRLAEISIMDSFDALI